VVLRSAGEQRIVIAIEGSARCSHLPDTGAARLGPGSR
jgi:hypothetical protein